MDLEKYILSLLEGKFTEEEWTDCFVIDIEIQGKKISVYVDADQGIDFNRCIAISRYLEQDLDTNSKVPEDYVLEVSSPGLDRPLKYRRQYIRNIGRKARIKLSSGETVEGIIKEFTDGRLELEIKKKKAMEVRHIEFDQIESTNILISY